MRVAFVYHPWGIDWNHGCAVLSAWCQRAGIETSVFPLHEGFDGDGFDWVVVSFVTVHDYRASLPCLRKIEAPMVAGGVFARKGAEIDTRLFVHVCRGEGQRLPAFFLNGDRSVFESPALDTDIDIFPDYSSVSGYEFGRGIPFLAGKKLAPYGHSRGCPYRCSFCEVKNLDKWVRVKSHIEVDLQRLDSLMHPDLFYFMDETLPYYHAGWRRQFDGNSVPFLSFIRADILPQHLMFLINNGLYACAIGVESGDEDYRNGVLNKGVTDEQIFRTVETLDKHGVERLMLYMRNCPGETLEQQVETFEMAERLGGYPMIFEYEVL